MSVESALLAQVRPQLLAAKSRHILRGEATKGCHPYLACQPVALEPIYQCLSCGAQLTPKQTIAPEGHQSAGYVTDDEAAPQYSPATPVTLDELVRLQVWVSPEQKCDWIQSERFIKQLGSVRHRVGLELVGNQEQINLLLLCHNEDLPIVQAAFAGEFDCCVLTPAGQQALTPLVDDEWADLVFEDYLPPPPYSHLLTRFDELRHSPYGSIMAALSDIRPPAVGLYQVLMQPVLPQHDWHYNVQRLLDLEFTVKLMTGWQPPQRMAQQVPSGDLREMAMDTQTKAHDDKPFFAAALRVAVIVPQGSSQAVLHSAPGNLRSLSTFVGLLQHGGRPLERLTAEKYRQSLTHRQLQEMFALGQTYRAGFLVNSWELTSLVHVPPVQMTEHRAVAPKTLEILSADSSLTVGTPIGLCHIAGFDQPVGIPPDRRREHVHLIGATGMGKSTVMERMIQYELRRGEGVALLDPHGPLVRRTLDLIPKEHVDRVIYLDMGDRQWVPMWNPLRCGGSQSIGGLADGIVRAFKGFMADSWGHRLEHLLHHAISGVLHLPDGNLLDVADVLRQRSEESRRLRQQIQELVEYPLARSFWRTDFDNYSKADLTPPQHKLGKLLGEDTVAWMLSQPYNTLDFRQIMDKGQILLINLATTPSEVREMLGAFVLSLLHHAAFSRAATPRDRHKPFHVYCDEAHRFVTGAMEDLISETRKFNVSLTLAHQYTRQFSQREIDAVSTVGSTVIFKVNSTDAAYLCRNLQGRVQVNDLARLDYYEAIARIGNQIVHLHTYEQMQAPEQTYREQIIELSHQRYCRPLAQVKQLVLRRSERYATVEPSPALSTEKVPPTDSSVSAPPTGVPPNRVSSDVPKHQPKEFDFETF